MRRTSYMFERRYENCRLANNAGRQLAVARLGTGAGAAGHERNFFAMAEAEDGLDFGGGVGEEDGARHGAET
jgi:hypothetical protein